MAAGAVVLPAQGTGTNQPDIAVDSVAGKEYQYVKLVDGTVDGLNPAPVTQPTADAGAPRAGLWVNGQLMVFNGSTWDRLRGSVANGLLVDVSRFPAGGVNIAGGTVAVTDGGGSLTVDGTVAVSGTVPVTGTVTSNLGTLNGASTDAVLQATIGQAADAEATGNGTLNAIVKRLRTLLAGGLPAALVGGRLDTNLGAWLGSAAPTVGQKAMAAAIPVVIASDQSAIPITGGAAGGTSMVDDAAFSVGVSSVTPMGALFDDVSPDTVNEGDIGAPRMTQLRAVHVNLRDTTGAEVVIGGGGGAGTEYIEDAPAAANPQAPGLTLVRADTLAAVTDANGDNVAARGTNKGELYVKQVDPQPVTDNGGSLTVDGSVSITGTVTIGPLPAGTNNIGDVDVLTLPALPAGTNNIGDVDVLTVPADPFGANADASAPTGGAGSMSAKLRTMTGQLNALVTGVPLSQWIGSTAPTVGQKAMAASVPVTIASDQPAQAVSGTVAVSTLPALPAGTNNIGDVDVLTLPPLSAGTNNIGDVDVLTLPSLPAGGNNIGDVDVLTLPADPLGANADAVVAAGAAGSLSAKLRRTTQGLEDLKTGIVQAQLPAALVGGRLDQNIGAWLGSTVPTVGQKVMASSIPIVIASDQGAIPVTGLLGVSVLVETNFTRPADTTAYANNDQVCNSTSAPTVLTFAGCAAANAGAGLIVGCELIDESVPLTSGQFELWLFDTTRTPNNDNSAFNPTVAQLRTVVAVIPLNLSFLGGTGRVYSNNAVGVKFKCAAGTTSLFGNLVAKNAYTPANAGRFDFRLFIEQS